MNLIVNNYLFGSAVFTHDLLFLALLGLYLKEYLHGSVHCIIQCVSKKTSPTFLAVTLESIVGFS